MNISRRTILLSLVSSAVFGIREARASLTPVKPFSFAFVTDVHLTNEMKDTHILFHESQLFLQEAVKSLNKLNPDFVIFGGDQVEGPGKDDVNWNLFVDIVQNLSCPWNFVLGDRDIASDSFMVDKMRTFGLDWKGKGIESETPYWSTNPAHNVNLIGLDTSKNASKAGYVSGKQLAWLKDNLARNMSNFSIVFSHHPILAPSPYDGASPWSNYALEEAGAVREVLSTSPYVKLCLSGHVGVNKLSSEGGIYYVSAAGLAQYPCSFKLFRVEPDRILMETYQVEFKALVNKSREALLESNLAYYYQKSNPKEYLKVAEGDKVDCDAELPLKGGMSPSYRRRDKVPDGKKDTNQKNDRVDKRKKRKFGLF
ncbi:MAG: metallophosphoesterase [Cyanobacteriota/Melainabacteria group bacterium]